MRRVRVTSPIVSFRATPFDNEGHVNMWYMRMWTLREIDRMRVMWWVWDEEQ